MKKYFVVNGYSKNNETILTGFNCFKRKKEAFAFYETLKQESKKNDYIEIGVETTNENNKKEIKIIKKCYVMN